MHGNVWEWTSDIKSNYTSSSQIDPTGAVTGSEKVYRGGAWNMTAGICDPQQVSRIASARRDNIGFRLALRQISLPPTDLNSTAPLTIAENQPIGTIVGDFNATDPDASATLTYHLVSGVGDGNNSLFTMESNGTLKTATILDYESRCQPYPSAYR